MIVSPLQLELSEEQRRYFKVTSKTRYQFTVGKKYTVYAVEFSPDSTTDYTVYRLLNDFNALIPAPACLFLVVDARTSPSWRVVHNPQKFSLAFEPKEFIDDPALSEAILDREPRALEVFQAIKNRMDAEGL